ncbi:MAG: flippase-like domain-containing protein [Actinomycetota bacterium]
MRGRTALLLAAGIVVFLGYAGLLTWILSSRGLPSLGLIGLSLVAVAIPVQWVAIWLFGEQFHHALAQTGRHLSRRSAFRAALIGAGVARLLPAGGAVTPVAMSWSARSEVRGTTGAAVRATTLNYAGLLIGTGVLLLWIAFRERILPEAVGAAIGVGVVLLALGSALIFGSSRLGTLVRMLPLRLRRRLESAFEDHAADPRGHGLLWSRLAGEAAVLGLVLFAFRIRLTPAQVFVAFGMSQLAGGLPGTPGGLGLAEAGLVGALVAFGVPAEAGLAPTLVYRLISYWMPVAAGLIAGGAAFLKTRRAGTVENGPEAA